jgi:hypothetical protein
MDRTLSEDSYADRAYVEGIKGAIEQANTFTHLTSSRTLRTNQKLQAIKKKDNRNIADLQYQNIQNT